MNQTLESSTLHEAKVHKNDWEQTLLDSVAKRGSGHTPDKKHSEYWGGPIKWISLQDSAQLDALYIDDTSATITAEGIKNSSAVIHPKGTVVLSRDAGVGKSAIMTDEMAVSQHFMAWTCGNRLDNHFLYYWLQSKKSEFERIANGNTIKTIGLLYFKELTIPLPSLQEQKRIASALLGVDNFISSLDQLIAKKRDIRQATMQQLLTGRRRLPGFSEVWQLKLLGDIADMNSGGTPPTLVSEYYGGDISWVSISDMTHSGKVIYSTEKNLTDIGLRNCAAQIFPAQTVLYAMYASIGECSIAGTPMCTSQAILGIRAKPSLLNEFIYYYLVSIKAQVKKMGQQGTQANLNAGIVRAFEIEVPPLEEQTAIATVLSDIDAELTALEARNDKAKRIKQGMMSDLLTGRIRFA